MAFVVRDKNGNVVKEFDTREDLNAWLGTQNPDTKFTEKSLDGTTTSGTLTELGLFEGNTPDDFSMLPTVGDPSWTQLGKNPAEPKKVGAFSNFTGKVGDLVGGAFDGPASKMGFGEGLGLNDALVTAIAGGGLAARDYIDKLDAARGDVGALSRVVGRKAGAVQPYAQKAAKYLADKIPFTPELWKAKAAQDWGSYASRNVVPVDESHQRILQAMDNESKSLARTAATSPTTSRARNVGARPGARVNPRVSANTGGDLLRYYKPLPPTTSLGTSVVDATMLMPDTARVPSRAPALPRPNQAAPATTTARPVTRSPMVQTGAGMMRAPTASPSMVRVAARAPSSGWTTTAPPVARSPMVQTGAGMMSLPNPEATTQPSLRPSLAVEPALRDVTPSVTAEPKGSIGSRVAQDLSRQGTTNVPLVEPAQVTNASEMLDRFGNPNNPAQGRAPYGMRESALRAAGKVAQTATDLVPRALRGPLAIAEYPVSTYYDQKVNDPVAIDLFNRVDDLDTKIQEHLNKEDYTATKQNKELWSQQLQQFSADKRLLEFQRDKYMSQNPFATGLGGALLSAVPFSPYTLHPNDPFAAGPNILNAFGEAPDIRSMRGHAGDLATLGGRAVGSVLSGQAGGLDYDNERAQKQFQKNYSPDAIVDIILDELREGINKPEGYRIPMWQRINQYKAELNRGGSATSQQVAQDLGEFLEYALVAQKDPADAREFIGELMKYDDKQRNEMFGGIMGKWNELINDDKIAPKVAAIMKELRAGEITQKQADKMLKDIESPQGE